MTEPKPLTYDERKAAEAAFCGYPPNPEWTDSALEIYARLSAAMTTHKTATLDPANKEDFEVVPR